MIIDYSIFKSLVTGALPVIFLAPVILGLLIMDWIRGTLW